MRPLVLLPLLALAGPAFAQETAQDDGTTTSSAPVAEGKEPLLDSQTGEVIQAADGEILVIATRIKGQVDAPQAPLLVMDEAEIASYGAQSISDLLDLLSPQTGSGRGRGGGHPVMLVNGRRISSFREIRDLPPEAIRRMEILPEEVALRFGYPPNQRVVNFILKDDFAAKTVAAEYEPSTHGGTADSEIEATLLKIDGQKRFNLTGKVENTSMLTEGERGVIQTPANRPTVASDPDPADFRSLIDASREYSLNGTWSTGLGQGPQAAALTINGTVTHTDTRALEGLDTFELVGPAGSAVRSLPDPLTSRGRTTAFESGVTFVKPLGGWNLTATADGSYSDARRTIDRPRSADAIDALVAAAAAGSLAVDGALPAVTPGGVDRARTQNYAINSLVTVTGAPFRMPAGEAMATIKGGYSYSRSESTDTRSSRDMNLGRGNLSAGVNLGLPITSRKNGVLGAVGDISLNFSAGLSRLSDFGTLTDWSAGMNWAPTDKLSFQASYIVDEAAPSLSQLVSPTVQSFNVSVFDFTTGQTVLVTTISGGNRDLRRETQRDIKLAANWQLPFFKNSSNLILEYFRNRSSDVTQAFPLVTPEIEAAFPGRVVRDASGRLLLIDRRAVTFSEIESSRLRWGFNVSGTLGKPLPGGGQRFPGMGRPGGPGGAPGTGTRTGGGMGRGPGGPGAGGMRGGFGPGGPGGPGGNGQGRWNLSLVHTIEFTNSVLVAPGGPVLDLLDGSALTAGGVPRHGFEMEGGGFYRGFGLRLNGNWSAPVTVRATGAPGSTDLRFGSVLKLNLRAFVNFDQRPKLIKDVPFLKGARLMIKVDNLLDQRQRVTNAAGEVPLSYQPDYRDPRGRVIGLDFRKMF